MKKETLTFRLSPAETQILLSSLFIRIERMKRYGVDESDPLVYGHYSALSALADKLTQKVNDSKFRSVLAWV